MFTQSVWKISTGKSTHILNQLEPFQIYKPIQINFSIQRIYYILNNKKKQLCSFITLYQPRKIKQKAHLEQERVEYIGKQSKNFKTSRLLILIKEYMIQYLILYNTCQKRQQILQIYNITKIVTNFIIQHYFIRIRIQINKFTMAPLSIKISMLKRLFPHEPTFVCAKLEDEYGYSLSNASMVSKLLKNSNRLSAIPESFTKDLIGKMHVTHDLNELTFMLKSITQTIIAKLAEAELGSLKTQMEIMQLIVPVGFSLQQKAINHNTALTLKRIFENERLQFLDDQSYALISQLLITLQQFWTNDLIFQHQFLLNLTVDLLEILTKSAAFSSSYKTPQIVNSLMSVSKLDFVSAQTRSRIIKLISFLSRPQFTNCFQPRSYDGPLTLNLPPQPRRRNEEYVPTLLEQQNRTSNRRQGSAGSRNQNGYEQNQDFNQNGYKQNESNQYAHRQSDSNQYGFKQITQYTKNASFIIIWILILAFIIQLSSSSIESCIFKTTIKYKQQTSKQPNIQSIWRKNVIISL